MTSSAQARLRSVRQSGTKPELSIRRELHRRGYRFRVNDRRFKGTPDIVLPRHGVMLFVHGCFWHRHLGCPRASIPKSNMQFWLQKFDRNIDRDMAVKRHLEQEGWRHVVVWECDIERDAGCVVDELELKVLSSRETTTAEHPRRTP